MDVACRFEDPADKRHGRWLRIRRAPRREPPFDDELEPPITGSFDQPLPFSLGPCPPVAIALPRATDDGLPDPAAWARRLLVGIVEVAGGKRPLQQLGGLLSPSIAHGLRTDFHRAFSVRARHWTHAATVRSVRASEPVSGVAEVCATLQLGRRVRAVALRAEAVDGRWQCTRLQLG